MPMVRRGGAPSSSSAAAAVPAPPSPRTLMLTMMTWYNTLTAGAKSSGSAARRSSATTPMTTETSGIPFVDTHTADLDSIVTFGAHEHKRVSEVLKDLRYCKWVLSSMRMMTGRKWKTPMKAIANRIAYEFTLDSNGDLRRNTGTSTPITPPPRSAPMTPPPVAPTPSTPVNNDNELILRSTELLLGTSPNDLQLAAEFAVRALGADQARPYCQLLEAVYHIQSL